MTAERIRDWDDMVGGVLIGVRVGFGSSFRVERGVQWVQMRFLGS